MGFPRCVEYLLRNDADPGVKDRQGYNAVHYASAYGRTLCLELVSTDPAVSANIFKIRCIFIIGFVFISFRSQV